MRALRWLRFSNLDLEYAEAGSLGCTIGCTIPGSPPLTVPTTYCADDLARPRLTERYSPSSRDYLVSRAAYLKHTSAMPFTRTFGPAGASGEDGAAGGVCVVLHEVFFHEG